MLTFATRLKFKEIATQSEHQHFRAGERRPREAPGFTRGGRRVSLWQRVKKALPGPNWWRGGRERGGRRTRLRETLCCSFFSFLTGARCSNQAENYFRRGTGIFFSSRIFRFHFTLFLRCCCAAVPCCAFSFFVHTAYRKNKLSTLPGVCTYVRQPPAMRSVCGVRAVFS